MIKIRRGNTRIAIILFSFLVVKFPNPRFDQVKVFRILSPLRLLKHFYWAFIYGLSVNLSEVMIYLNTRKVPFLTPVFSIGICNFMVYQGEEQPARKELVEFRESLSDKAKALLDEADLHQWAWYNWRKTRHGLRLIDYGEDSLRGSFARFIRSSATEIEKATAQK